MFVCPVVNTGLLFRLLACGIAAKAPKVHPNYDIFLSRQQPFCCGEGPLSRERSGITVAQRKTIWRDEKNWEKRRHLDNLPAGICVSRNYAKAHVPHVREPRNLKTPNSYLPNRS